MKQAAWIAVGITVAMMMGCGVNARLVCGDVDQQELDIIYRLVEGARRDGFRQSDVTLAAGSECRDVECLDCATAIVNEVYGR